MSFSELGVKTLRRVEDPPPDSGDEPRGGEELLDDIYDSYYMSPLGGDDQHYIEELRTSEGYIRFVRMIESNPQVCSFRNVVGTLGSRVNWWVGEKDEPNDADPREELLRRAIDLLTRDSGGWTRIVSQAMLAPVYGAAIFEVTYNSDNPAEVLWENFSFRPYYSIDEVLVDDNNEFVGLRQTSDNFRSTSEISSNSLLVVTHQPEYGILGRSSFYPSYAPYRRREDMEPIALLGLRRTLNAPAVFEPQGGKAPNINENSSDKQIIELRKRLDGLRDRVNKGQQGALIGLPGYKYTMPQGAGSRSFEANTLLQRQDHAILQPVNAAHFLLPSGKVGSYALANINQAVFSLAIDSYLDRFADAVNRIEVPRLLTLNGMDTTDAPRINHGSVADLVHDAAATSEAPAEPESQPDDDDDETL